MVVAADVSPGTLLNETPCLECLSKSQLLALQAILYADAQSVDLIDTLSTQLANGACHSCLSPKQNLQEVVAAMIAKYEPNTDWATLRSKIKCLECLGDARLRGLLTYLEANYWTNTVSLLL